MALQQGVAEGQENALGTIDSKKYYEVQKFVMLTGHITSPRSSDQRQVFESLPENYRNIVLDAVKEARALNNKLQLEADERAKEKFTKLGMKIIEPDVEAFRRTPRSSCRSCTPLGRPAAVRAHPGGEVTRPRRGPHPRRGVWAS